MGRGRSTVIVGDSRQMPPTLAGARSRHPDEIREQVAAAIRDRGHDVVVGHGLSEFTVDIAVRRPGAAQWQVAIILDGPDWAHRSTVADRDAAPLHLSRQMSWPVLLRFWLPAWLRDPEAFLREVDDAVTRARAAAEPPPTASGPAVRPDDPAPPAPPRPRSRARSKATTTAAEVVTAPAEVAGRAPAKRPRKKAPG